MAKCGSDAFDLAQRGERMNVAAVIQHTSGEYLGLIEDQDVAGFNVILRACDRVDKLFGRVFADLKASV